MCLNTLGLLGRKKSKRPCVDICLKPQNHRPWFSRGTDICWEDSAARHTQPRSFLRSTNDNVLIEMMKKPAMRIVLLDLY